MQECTEVPLVIDMLAPSSLKRKRQPKVEIARRKQEDRERLFSASQAIEDASPSVAGSSKLDDDEDAGKRRSIAKVVEIALWSWTFDPNDLSIEGEAPDTCKLSTAHSKFDRTG